MQHNRIKNPTGRRQPVGYLQAWPRIWTRDYLEQIQQVAIAGFEPGTLELKISVSVTWEQSENTEWLHVNEVFGQIF